MPLQASLQAFYREQKLCKDYAAYSSVASTLFTRENISGVCLRDVHQSMQGHTSVCPEETRLALREERLI